jgi:drug/metabolite transporter (DMT)-like permease
MFIKSLDALGLSRCNQWKNLQGPIGAIISLIFLAEYKSTNWVFIILSIITLLISAQLFIAKNKDETKEFRLRGVMFAISSAFLFGINIALQKFVSARYGVVEVQQICFSSAIVLTMLSYFLIKEKSLKVLGEIKTKNSLFALLAGLIYFLAIYFSINAYILIPGAIASLIGQFNAVWTVLIGIFIFKEIDFKRNFLRISLGIIFAVLSISLLMFA